MRTQIFFSLVYLCYRPSHLPAQARCPDQRPLERIVLSPRIPHRTAMSWIFTTALISAHTFILHIEQAQHQANRLLIGRGGPEP
jgi:hypothetical protein